MAQKYDVVVLGSGPAGNKAAGELNKAGLTVAVVEDYGFGGTCPLRGCEPKKMLVEHTNTAARVRDQREHGVAGEVRIDWPRLMSFNRSFVTPISDRVESRLNQIGVDTYFGRGVFIGPDTVRVGDEDLQGRFILAAVGAMPRPLEVPGKEYVASSDDFLEMGVLPKSILFMGGGFISFELGHVAARAGAEVAILEVMDRPLGPFDPDLAGLLVQASREAGIRIETDCPVQSVQKRGEGYVVKAGQAGDRIFEAEMVVHGAGRVPAVAGLGLEAAGVEYTPAGITVNEYLQSVSNPKVYAAGDAARSAIPLTPVAAMEGAAAAYNIVHGNKKTTLRENIPSAVFTYPPLAAVGLKESDAEKLGIKFRTIYQETGDWTENKRIGLKYGGVKVLVDDENDRVVGAHILGDRAEEMINIFALVMQHGIPFSRLQATIWAYPSSGYNLRYVIL